MPRYALIDFKIEDSAGPDDEVLAAGAMFITKNRGAFDELAK